MFSYIAEKLNVGNLGEILAPTLTQEEQLHAAIEVGMCEKVSYLVDELKVDPNARSSTGNLPIHTAAYHGCQMCAEFLLHRGCAPDALGPRDNTPLHLASAQGHRDLVQFLVEKGANPTIRNRNGLTPYDTAKGSYLRQYLLPLQFKSEDPSLVDTPLPPDVTPVNDPNAPRPGFPPPPTAVAAGLSTAIPNSTSRVKKDATVFRPIQADGFGTSVGNEELTAKYGNKREIRQTDPPPIMQTQCGSTVSAAPAGVNIYSSGGNPYAHGRYTTYDVATNSGQAACAAPGGAPPSSNTPPKPAYTIFRPVVTTAQVMAPDTTAAVSCTMSTLPSVNQPTAISSAPNAARDSSQQPPTAPETKQQLHPFASGMSTSPTLEAATNSMLPSTTGAPVMMGMDYVNSSDGGRSKPRATASSTPPVQIGVGVSGTPSMGASAVHQSSIDLSTGLTTLSLEGLSVPAMAPSPQASHASEDKDIDLSPKKNALQ